MVGSMDVAAVITATGGLINAAGGFVAIDATRQKVKSVHQTIKTVEAKVDNVHDLVNSKSESDARYQVQLIELLKAKGITVPTNKHP